MNIDYERILTEQDPGKFYELAALESCKDNVIIIDCNKNLIHKELEIDNNHRGNIKSIADYSHSFIFKNCNIGLGKIKTKKILGLDSNVIGNLNLLLNNKSVNNPKFIELIEYLKNNSDIDLDATPYLIENLYNEYPYNEAILIENLKTFFKFDSERKNSKSISESDLDEKAKYVTNTSNDCGKKIKYFQKVYFIFYSLILKAFLIKTDGQNNKVERFLEFYASNYNNIYENELILLISYLKNNRDLDKFFRLNSNEKTTSEKRYEKIKKFKAMAFDLVMIRLSEDMLVVHNNKSNNSRDELVLYYFFTNDKGLSSAIDFNKVKRMIITNDKAHVLREKNINDFRDSNFIRILERRITTKPTLEKYQYLSLELEKSIN